jgi:fibronectin-binding autotransporter adhesin
MPGILHLLTILQPLSIYKRITFSGSNNYRIGGNSITLLSGGIMLDNSVTSATDILSLNITLDVGQIWSVTNANATLAVGGMLNGTAGLTKAGAGTLALTANNANYAGDTTLTSGTLSLRDSGALGGGVLDFFGGTLLASAPLTLANQINVNAATGATTTIGGSNNLTLTSPIGAITTVALLNASAPLMISRSLVWSTLRAAARPYEGAGRPC